MGRAKNSQMPFKKIEVESSFNQKKVIEWPIQNVSRTATLVATQSDASSPSELN